MKSKLYTRTGDDGTTSLVDGSRALKCHPRVEAYGDIDELSSALGLVASSPKCPDEIRGQLRHIQNLLFTVGAYLATPQKEEAGGGVIPEGESARLEGWIDVLDEQTPPMKNFILPGGNEEASRCHLARTICRRAERKITALSQEAPVDSELEGYINRLSDYLFIAARYLNFIDGIDDIPWKKQ